MIIVDAHRDIAFDAIELERDYALSVAEVRALEQGQVVEGRETPAATGLPDAIAGGIAVVGAVIFTEPATFESWGSVKAKSSYSTPAEAYELGRAHLEYYKAFAARDPRVQIIYTRRDLDAVLATWADDADESARRQGFILLMEGADPIVDPSQFGEWWNEGLRILGTSWSRTRYAGGTRAPGPLTDLGRALLREMAPYNALLDVSHMSEESCMEALQTYDGPIIASHANPRAFSDTDRHLTDEAIRLLAERDGVMGMVLLNLFWKTDYRLDQPELIPLSRVLDGIDYVCQLTGSARHVGIGSDWYAGMGSHQYPEGLDTVRDLVKIAQGLRERGYAEDDVRNIMAGNFLRKYAECLPA